MTNITLTVAEAFPTDFGCGVARVGPDVLSTLNASPGDIVEIEANRNSVATIWRSDRQDWESNTVRIDEFTQRNAGVDLKDDVTIGQPRL